MGAMVEVDRGGRPDEGHVKRYFGSVKEVETKVIMQVWQDQEASGHRERQIRKTAGKTLETGKYQVSGGTFGKTRVWVC